jgi:hypothetical protein
MSIGNLKDSGNQGNNFPWQLKMLLGQQCACDALQEVVANTDDVEPLLIQILAAIQAGTDYEAALVVDSADVTWLEIRVWNGTTFDPPVYYLAGSNTSGTPAFPITYINPNTYLAQIVSNTTGLATETTWLSVDSNAAQLVTNTTSVTRTPGIATLTGAGLTTAGVYSFSIANIGSASGLVGGESIPAGMTVSFDGGSLNNTLGSISYDATGTTFIITYIS